MIIARYSLVATSVVGLLGAMTSRGDEVLPAHPSFDRYSGMVGRSPFAIATAVALPAATPDFAKDLYLANAARLPGGDLITIASSSDHNFKKYLITGQDVDGFTISSVEWSDRVGATKVTIGKGGNFATLTFNQALLSQRVASNAPPVPVQVAQSVTPPQVVPSMPEAPRAARGVVQQKPGAPPLTTPNPAPESPPRPDPPSVTSPEQRSEQKMQMQRQLKAASERPVAPTQPGEEAYLNVRP